MKYDEETQEFVLELSGRRFGSCTRPIIGVEISPKIRNLFTGYDQQETHEVGGHECWRDGTDLVPLTKQEKAEIAAFMVRAWCDWGDLDWELP